MDDNPSSNGAPNYYPDPSFEDALAGAFPNRGDIHDMARLGYYQDFQSVVDSYAGISEEEIDAVRVFLGEHRPRKGRE